MSIRIRARRGRLCVYTCVCVCACFCVCPDYAEMMTPVFLWPRSAKRHLLLTRVWLSLTHLRLGCVCLRFTVFIFLCVCVHVRVDMSQPCMSAHVHVRVGLNLVAVLHLQTVHVIKNCNQKSIFFSPSDFVYPPTISSMLTSHLVNMPVYNL